MPAPANLSFETAGASAGLAASWTTTITATEDVADFDDGSGVPKGIEDYSYGWPGFPLDTTIGIGSATATFDETFITPPKTIEQYDRWQAATFRIDLTGGIAAQFDGALTMEDYSFGWQTGSFTSEFAPGPPDVFEDYDTGWPGDPYQTEITLGGGGTEGRFDTPLGTVAIESYEHTFADVPFVVDLSNNIFVCDTPHGLTSNQKGEVIFTAPAGDADDQDRDEDLHDHEHGGAGRGARRSDRAGLGGRPRRRDAHPRARGDAGGTCRARRTRPADVAPAPASSR